MKYDDRLDDDTLAELLAAPSISPSSPDLVRDVVLTQAGRVLRRRRWIHRGARVATLAVCYCAGLATMALIRHEAPQPVAGLNESAAENSLEKSIEPATAGTSDIQEAVAFADQVTPTRSSFGFFRAAGDYQLLRCGNLQAAIRLYSQALDLASPADLTISAGSDSWLLMSLKQSRLEDAPHVHDEG